VSGVSTTPADSIAINYEADFFNTIPTTSGTKKPTDCLGFGLTQITGTLPTVTATSPSTITSTVSYYVAENRFYIGTSSTIRSPSLYCKGNGGSGTQQPLVENIEDMQFEYGTVVSTATTTMPTGTTASTAPVAGYLRADQIASPTDAGLAALVIGDRWNKVTAVRICVVVRSESPMVSDAASGQYYKCDGSLDTTKTDLRLRRAYFTTVSLRNQQLWLP
jgi:type IV pilus assembly protein PilW